jgi:hypothetical protein
VGAGPAPPDRHGVARRRHQRRHRAALEEHVASGDGEELVAPFEVDGGAEHQGVEVAGVVGRQDERGLGRQVMPAVDL